MRWRASESATQPGAAQQHAAADHTHGYEVQHVHHGCTRRPLRLGFGNTRLSCAAGTDVEHRAIVLELVRLRALPSLGLVRGKKNNSKNRVCLLRVFFLQLHLRRLDLVPKAVQDWPVDLLFQTPQTVSLLI